MSERVTDAEVQEWIRNAERQIREDDARFKRDKARFECTERAINAAIGLYCDMVAAQMYAIMWGIGEIERRRQ